MSPVQITLSDGEMGEGRRGQLKRFKVQPDLGSNHYRHHHHHRFIIIIWHLTHVVILYFDGVGRELQRGVIDRPGRVTEVRSFLRPNPHVFLKTVCPDWKNKKYWILSLIIINREKNLTETTDPKAGSAGPCLGPASLITLARIKKGEKYHQQKYIKKKIILRVSVADTRVAVGGVTRVIWKPDNVKQNWKQIFIHRYFWHLTHIFPLAPVSTKSCCSASVPATSRDTWWEWGWRMLACVATLCWGGGDTGETVTVIMTLTMSDIRGPGGVAICVCLIVGMKYLPTFIFRFYSSEWMSVLLQFYQWDPILKF